MVVGIPAVAVTLAVLVVVSVATAVPFPLVLTTGGLTVPLSVVNVTGTPLNAGVTTAVIVDLAPGATVAGLALTPMPGTAAAPTAILSAAPLATTAPPELAEIVATPEAVPARNFATARPLMSVSTSVGSIVPSDVMNVM